MISPGEWDDAHRMEVSWSYRSTLGTGDMERHDPACLIMNDETYLYIAFVIRNDEYREDDSIRVIFDNDGDAENSSDVEDGDDFISLSASGRLSDGFRDARGNSFIDTRYDGSLDVAGATSYTNPVRVGMGDYVFELRHPLRSSDSEHDINLSPGDSTGCHIIFFDRSGGGISQPRFPRGGFARIMIQSAPSKR